jgi:hypothetical protein
MAFEQQSLSRAVLPDGSVIHVRPITPDDKARLCAAFERLSPTRVDHPEPGLAELTINLPEEILPDGELYAALRHVAAGHLRPAPVSRDPRP